MNQRTVALCLVIALVSAGLGSYITYTEMRGVIGDSEQENQVLESQLTQQKQIAAELRQDKSNLEDENEELHQRVRDQRNKSESGAVDTVVTVDCNREEYLEFSELQGVLEIQYHEYEGTVVIRQLDEVTKGSEEAEAIRTERDEQYSWLCEDFNEGDER